MNTLELEQKVSGILETLGGPDNFFPPEFKEWLSVKLKGMYIIGYSDGKKRGKEIGLVEGRSKTLAQCSEMTKIFGKDTKARIDELVKVNKRELEKVRNSGS